MTFHECLCYEVHPCILFNSYLFLFKIFVLLCAFKTHKMADVKSAQHFASFVPPEMRRILMKDTYRNIGLRKKLINSLRKKGIKAENVLAAMESLPRHFFIDSAFEDWAYKDKAFPIGMEQTISQPYTVAYQTELLDIQKRDKVLEIGTGSGYQAAILALLGAHVYTVERHEALHKKARKLLMKLKFKGIRCFLSDGTLGLNEFAPFDKILVTAGATEIPQALLDQLKIGGFLVIPVGKDSQKMIRMIKTGEDEFTKEVWGDFRFVPFLKGINKEK